MKRKIIISLSIILSLFTSCGSSQLYESGGMNYSTYKGGFWGEWSNFSWTGDTFLFQDDKFIYTLINYSHSSHPSEYKYKIELIDNKPSQTANGWYEYQGKIYCLSDTECFDNIQEYYTVKKACKPSFDNRYEKYYIFQCTIRTNKRISDLVKKGKGTINVFYNGVGRAWSF